MCAQYRLLFLCRFWFYNLYFNTSPPPPPHRVIKGKVLVINKRDFRIQLTMIWLPPISVRELRAANSLKIHRKYHWRTASILLIKEIGGITAINYLLLSTLPVWVNITINMLGMSEFSVTLSMHLSNY